MSKQHQRKSAAIQGNGNYTYLDLRDHNSMSPFDSALAEESEEVLISDAIAQQREIATWKIDPAWGGSYPSSTWDFLSNMRLQMQVVLR